MSKLLRDNIERTYTEAGALRAEDIPSDATNSIQAVLDSLKPYTDTFVDGDLTTGVLTVTHNKGIKGVQVAVLDNSDSYVTPDGITYVSDNEITVDLTTQGTLTGTWTVVVR